MFDPRITLLLLGIGIIAGMIMCILGSSAVMIIVPSLHLLFDYPMNVAIGISLLVDVLASIAVSYAYWRKGNVKINEAIWVSAGAFIGAQLGAGYSIIFPEWLMTIGYTVWMILAGITIWKKGKEYKNLANNFFSRLNYQESYKKHIISGFLGIIIGINAGLFGAGGGALVMLVLLFIMGFSPHDAVGTSTIIMAFTALSAVVHYWNFGNLNIYSSIVITLGTTITGTLGATMISKVNEGLLFKMIGIVFVSLGLILTIINFL